MNGDQLFDLGRDHVITSLPVVKNPEPIIRFLGPSMLTVTPTLFSARKLMISDVSIVAFCGHVEVDVFAHLSRFARPDRGFDHLEVEQSLAAKK